MINVLGGGEKERQIRHIIGGAFGYHITPFAIRLTNPYCL